LLVEAWKITRPVPAGVTVAVSVTEPPNVIVDEESAVVVVVEIGSTALAYLTIVVSVRVINKIVNIMNIIFDLFIVFKLLLFPFLI
jgi:hypothetical protein